ncbi:glutathione S-transferase family protein [Tardiphaga sp. 866_E4_N2_1]|uniref:glutathione S-transferase family protein n=1 Tax=unclassified Tardiphaga TaxID=2631404 RepID=UPI0008A7E074|nr:glutathione S-transferase family protein [Tardiphaga sp. OK245]SEH85667.1 Glutathione S-transferase [Tardiphaga sp. OK245]
MTATDLVLHHYPRSPFAEKVRVAFGLKGLHWQSVIQPRIAPKPELVALTGGYRRVPVLQIGADVYCDTRRILAELERRFPETTLYPTGTRGQADIIAAWADRALFANALGLVFGLNGDRFPPELHADRASFTSGKFDGWDSVKMREQIPALRNQFRIHLAWLSDWLAHGDAFLLGNVPSLADIAVYHPLWYARRNLGESEGLAEHPRVLAWMDRVAALGHGTVEELSPELALDIARLCQPMATSASPHNDIADDQGLPFKEGVMVSVMPTDWGFDPVIGAFVSAGHDSIALRREDPDVGATVVHFPRAGFAIARL